MAMTWIETLVRQAVANREPFIAQATAVSGGKVALTRLGAVTQEKYYGRLAGVQVAVADYVICLPLGSEVVVLGTLQNAAPSFIGVEAPVKIASAASIRSGSGSPEGAVTGSVGDVYLRTNGAAGTIIYEKATGTGNTGWVAVGGAPFVGVGTFPQGASQSNSEFDTALASNITHCMYMGRADAAYTNISLYIEVEVAAATITWAEVGVGTSDVAPAFGENMDITRRGYTNVASSFNSTGEKVVNVSVSGISPGDHLWALIGSQATTPYQTIRVNHSEDNGTWGYRSSTRISTMSAASTFTAWNSADTAGFGYWIGS